MVLWAAPLHAQSVQQGTQQFQQFLSMKDAGNAGSAYGTLWQCYQTLKAATPQVQAGTADYDMLRNTLRDMHPYLEQGWLYNSQMRQRNNSTLFGQAYLDIETLPLMNGVNLEHTANYPMIAYNTAAATYNTAISSQQTTDYQHAISYFKAYLSTGETKHRRNVLQFMFNACLKIKDNDSARGIIEELVAGDPTNANLLKFAINVCMENQDYAAMQRYLSKALPLSPNDASLLKLQAQLYEETQQYEQAIEVYGKLRAQNPRSLELAKHIGLCHYNLAVSYYNADAAGANSKRNKKLAKEHFTAAATDLANVSAQESNSLKYAQALATAYLYSEQTDKLAAANQRVLALGGVTVSEGLAPTAISVSSQTAGTGTPATAHTVTPQQGGTATATPQTTPAADELPLYSEFAKQYVEERLRKWQQKDPYETADEYKKRVTEETRNNKAKELLAQAEQDYINTYTKNIRLGRELTLRPYDAENRVFLVESRYGELIVPVPRENNEARAFENGWSGMEFSDPQFYISNDKLALASLTFRTPAGRTYQFTGNKALNYVETEVNVQFDKLDSDLFAANTQKEDDSKSKRQKQTVTVGQSDVDMDIPTTKRPALHTFAVVICNEDYEMVAPVPMAKNDGTVFAQYCQQTLGLPKDNVRLYQNASLGTMLRALADIKSIADAYQGEDDFNVIFYYAGHGIPNESTKDAYILPVDADGKQTEGCYSLKKLYARLGELGAASVVVFLDACFSGAQRDGNMLASARSVAIKPKDEGPTGNMIVFSAATGDETAMPYTDKQHGLFTYFLLKKLKESKGNTTLSELSDYISKNVRRQATVVNHKPQTPSVVPAQAVMATWGEMKLVH